MYGKNSSFPQKFTLYNLIYFIFTVFRYLNFLWLDLMYIKTVKFQIIFYSLETMIIGQSFIVYSVWAKRVLSLLLLQNLCEIFWKRINSESVTMLQLSYYSKKPQSNCAKKKLRVLWKHRKCFFYSYVASFRFVFHSKKMINIKLLTTSVFFVELHIIQSNTILNIQIREFQTKQSNQTTKNVKLTTQLCIRDNIFTHFSLQTPRIE